MPLDIPGRPIKPPERPVCPRCSRSYRKLKIREEKSKVLFLCPHCGAVIKKEKPESVDLEEEELE